MIKEKSES